MRKKLPIATGKTANTPDAKDPMLWLAVVTTTTQSATIAARQAISAGVAFTRCFALSTRNLRLAMIAAPITITLSTIALAGVQFTSRSKPAQTNHTAKAPARLTSSPRRCASSA